ncbi:polysaccharide deacetylase family protein [candidate division NPL-UPA2 bacterium]|nr:polysaccharide deacetylase family protein [candidate division NPL-UPA2 bacterium]
MTVSSNYFQGQLKYLVDQGYESIFLDDLVAYLKGEKPLPRRAVVLTFDDGYLDNGLYAYPILKKYKMKATIFVITSLAKDKHSGSIIEIPPHSKTRPAAVLGKSSSDYYLSWTEMREMEASGLVDIQSHTHTHKRLVELGVNVEAELSQSKAVIEKKLEKKCKFISWPWGACSDQVIALARKLGYRGGVTTRKGANTHGTDPMRIKRFDTEKGNLSWFGKRLIIYSHPTVARIYSAFNRG